jgi:hypothetical protein
MITTEQVACGKCPQPEVLYPCTCSEGIDRISCIKFNENDFNSSYTLPQIFESLSNSLENNEKAFTQLLLANTKVLELAENVFSDITFEKIEIYENNLTRIHSNAFFNTHLTVNEIYLKCLALKDSPTNYSLFMALSSLVNLEKLSLDLGLNSITAIPDNAFQPINGIQTKLEEINFNGIISSVGQYAFNLLPNLRKLKILSEINSISSHTFEFNATSTNDLEIDLSNNKLIASSFELNSFSNSKRPLNLNLNKNNLRYLDQSVFESFFSVDSRNKLSLLGNTLNCTDCRSYWLIDQKSSIGSRIDDTICHNQQSIWDYKWQCDSVSTPESNSEFKKLSFVLSIITLVINLLI